MEKNNPTQLTEQSTKIEQLLSEIIELQSVKHGTSFRTSQNYVPPVGETDFGPSQTQPNDVMSIREILDRFTRGLPLNTGDVGYYDDPEDIDMSDFDAMDKFEKEMYIREHKEYVAELEQRMKDTDPQDPVNSSAPKEQESARSETGHQTSDGQTTPME